MIYSIGNLAFDDLRGAIIMPTPNREIEARTGQDGLVVFSTGRRGEPFELESKFYCGSYSDAVNLANSYPTYFDASPKNIRRGSENYTGTGYQFIVLKVRARIEPVIAWSSSNPDTGNTRRNISPAFCVIGQWQLVCVEV